MRAFKLFATTGAQTIEPPGQGVALVGRAATSDVPIYDPTISRRHAELALAPNGVRVRDLDSSNGTFLNGARVAEAVAVDGDVVTFGKVAFHVREVTPAVARPAVDPSGLPGMPPGATIVRRVPAADAPLAPGRDSGAMPLHVEGESPDERRARAMALLLDISKELSKHQDVDKLLQKVVDITFEVMAVDRVSILMVEPTSGELIPRISQNRLAETAGGGSRHVPRSIAQRAVEERLAILTDNAATDERFKGKSILMQSVRSAMCAPLMGSGTVLGIIYVDNLTATNSFSDDDLDFLIAFSGIAAVAIENGQLTERVRREAVKLSNFQRYFAPNLAQQIAGQEGEVKLGGTKRPVVIFFSDIRGFTPLSERMLPDEIARLLTEYFTEMVEIVFQHGGTLDKFMGDAIMALWGAPIAHEDDADRAMQAALEMQQVLQELNAKWEAEGRERVEIGIGINFGEVFAGNIGSEQRLEYTVIGDAVNIASRLCAKAKAGDILVSDAFRQALKQPPKLQALEAIELKGKAKAVQVYRVNR